MIINLKRIQIQGVFNVKQYCLYNDIDLKAVTDLYCHDNQISELKGLEELINLKVLDCACNQLKELFKPIDLPAVKNC